MDQQNNNSSDSSIDSDIIITSRFEELIDILTAELECKMELVDELSDHYLTTGNTALANQAAIIKDFHCQMTKCINFYKQYYEDMQFHKNVACCNPPSNSANAFINSRIENCCLRRVRNFLPIPNQPSINDHLMLLLNDQVIQIEEELLLDNKDPSNLHTQFERATRLVNLFKELLKSIEKLNKICTENNKKTTALIDQLTKKMNKQPSASNTSLEKQLKQELLQIIEQQRQQMQQVQQKKQQPQQVQQIEQQQFQQQQSTAQNHYGSFSPRNYSEGQVPSKIPNYSNLLEDSQRIVVQSAHPAHQSNLVGTFPTQGNQNLETNPYVTAAIIHQPRNNNNPSSGSFAQPLQDLPPNAQPLQDLPPNYVYGHQLTPQAISSPNQLISSTRPSALSRRKRPLSKSTRNTDSSEYVGTYKQFDFDN